MPKYQMMYVHVEVMHSSRVLCTCLLLKRVDINKWRSPNSVRTRAPEAQVQGRPASAICVYDTKNESKADAVKESISDVSANTGCSPYTLTISAATTVLTDSSREYWPPHAKAIVAKDSACVSPSQITAYAMKEEEDTKRAPNHKLSKGQQEAGRPKKKARTAETAGKPASLGAADSLASASHPTMEESPMQECKRNEAPDPNCDLSGAGTMRRKVARKTLPFDITIEELRLIKKLRLEKTLSLDEGARMTASPEVSLRLSAADDDDIDDANTDSDPSTDTEPNAVATRATARWTTDEDAQLTSGVANTFKKKYGKENKTDWVAVAALVPDGQGKRKAVEEPEVVIKSKASRVNVDSSMTQSQIASLGANAPMTTANNPSAFTTANVLNERFRNILTDADETFRGSFLELADNDRKVLVMLRQFYDEKDEKKLGSVARFAKNLQHFPCENPGFSPEDFGRVIVEQHNLPEMQTFISGKIKSELERLGYCSKKQDIQLYLSVMYTKLTEPQQPHIDFKWPNKRLSEFPEKSSRERTKAATYQEWVPFIALFPLTEDGMTVQVWKDQSQHSDHVFGQIVEIPYGNILLLRADVIHAGGFKTAISGNPRCHFYIYKTPGGSVHTSPLANSYESHDRELLDQVFKNYNAVENPKKDSFSFLYE